MGFISKAAKKGAKAAGRKAGKAVVKKVNGGCPGSSDGKHNYRAGNLGGHMVVYCRNAGCGRTH